MSNLSELLEGIVVTLTTPSLLLASLLTLPWLLARFMIYGFLLYSLLLLARRNSGRRAGSLTSFRYAHRGLHDAQRPENSLTAFRAAAEQGFGAELDVHLTRDGRLAVIHDSELLRVCGRVGVVEELTAAELSQYTLCGTAERIPFLEEVVPLFVGKAPLLVELKTHRGNYAALAQAACAVLEPSGVDFCMESFDPRVLLWLRWHRPHVVRGQLSQDFSKAPDKLGRGLGFFLKNLLCNFFTYSDFIAYRFEDRGGFSPRLCLGLWKPAMFYWTIRTPEALRAAEAEGAHGIFEHFIPASPKKGEVI